MFEIYFDAFHYSFGNIFSYLGRLFGLFLVFYVGS